MALVLNFSRFYLIRRMFSSNINQQLVEKLSNSKIADNLGSSEKISELLENTRELNNSSLEQWENTFSVLKKLGFPTKKHAYMVSQYPKLMTLPAEKICDSVNNWLNFEFGEYETLQLLERYPEFLEITNFKRVNENLNIIKSFVGQKNGYKVLINTPSIAVMNSQNLQEKVNYLQKNMQANPIEVYKSDVFSKDIFKIKARHVFMDRLGLYFVSKKLSEENREKNKNEKLYKIMDTSDKRFATKVCHVSLEEYEAFEELYKKELAKEEKENYDSDDDDENDEDECHYSQ